MSASFAAFLAALCLSVVPQPEGAAGLLTACQWTDEATGRSELCFYANGRGEADSRFFAWSCSDGAVTLEYMSGSSVGAEEKLSFCFVDGSIKLLGEDALYVVGEAFTEEDERAAVGAAVAEYARQFEGCAYHYGGKTPEEGFDCSGLVYYVYGHFGYTLSRVAADQAKDGERIERWQLRAGDLICFKSGSYIGHVGIYLGSNEFIHAESSETGVVISEFADYYENRGYELVRVVA